MYFEIKEKEPVVTEPENSNEEENNQTNTNVLAPLKELEDEVKVDEIIKEDV